MTDDSDTRPVADILKALEYYSYEGKVNEEAFRIRLDLPPRTPAVNLYHVSTTKALEALMSLGLSKAYAELKLSVAQDSRRGEHSFTFNDQRITVVAHDDDQDWSIGSA